MKFKPNQDHTSIAIYAFLVIIAAILFYQAINHIPVLFNAGKAVLGFIKPIVFGFVIAFLLNPMMRIYEKRLTAKRLKPTQKRALSILMTYITMVFILGLFFRLVIPQIALSVESLVGMIPKYAELLNGFYNDIVTTMQNLHISSDAELMAFLEGFRESTLNTLNAFFSALPNYVADFIPRAFSAGARFTGGLIDILLGLIISIYFLADREKLFAQIKKIVNALFTPNTCRILYDVTQDANRVFSGFIIGKIIDSAIIGILCFILMSILNIPYAVLISVIVGVTNVIPYFGPFFGAIPSALILLIIDPMKMLIFLIMILVLQQFDGNILGPKILGDTTGLSPLWVIFSIMLFSGIFGLLGMFIGVPLFALIYIIVRRVVSYLLERKGLSTDTRDYASDSNPLIK